jgi:hypothetical protein
MIRCAVLLLSLLALAGCQRTLFENPPVATPGCDPDLVGEWRSEGDKRSEDGELVAFVGSACELVTVEHGNDGERRSQPTTLRTGRAGGVRYLWVDAAWANASFDVETHSIDRPGDVYLYAYALSRDVLRVATPPHRALAHRVIDKDIPGEISMRGDELVVRIGGDPGSVRAMLAKHRVFRMDEALRFRRAPEPAR